VGDAPELIKKAKKTGIGWMNLQDYRFPYSRAVPSEDLFGTVLLEKGEILPSTYQPIPSHRLVTDIGIFQMDEYLKQQLVKEIAKLEN